MPETPDPAAAAAAEEKQAAEERIAEHNAKLAEKLERTAETVAGIAERVAAQPAAQPQAAAQPQQPIRVTEEQVAAAIERGEITQAQGLQILARQTREDARAEARREVQATLAEASTQVATHQVASLIESYKAQVPALGRRGSEEWNEAAARFSELVRVGYPRTLATELQALREIYGPDPSRAGESREPVRERTKERATRGAETTSAASARAPSPRRRAGEPDPDLSADHRGYIERMIQIGQYKGWDDPRAVKYAERAKTIAAARGARRR